MNSGMRRSARTTSARWPFWLLIAAWVCANSPQIAMYTVLAWIADARTFSHQHQLTTEVAHVLAGEKTGSRLVMMAAAAAPDDHDRAQPAIPESAVLKKIDLASEKQREVTRPSEVAQRRPRTGGWRGDALRAPPPHGPPRDSGVS